MAAHRGGLFAVLFCEKLSAFDYYYLTMVLIFLPLMPFNRIGTKMAVPLPTLKKGI